MEKLSNVDISGVFFNWVAPQKPSTIGNLMLDRHEPFTKLGGGFKYVLFLPLPGEMIQFDEHMFSDGLVHPQTRKSSLPHL